MFTKTISFAFRLCSVLVLFTLLVSAVGVTPTHATVMILYARPGVTGDCSSWANACILQTALTGAVSGNEIWAAAGMYKPTTDPANRVATFHLKSDVALYGGFIGTETARDQRNPAVNITILSGDIDNNDSQTPIITNLTTVTGNTTNSYHVVAGVSNAILDGFTITAGNANDSTYPNNGGGGMLNYSSSPTLTVVTFNGNIATNTGGGMYNYSNSSPTLTNVTFNSNSASWGGGMFNDSSNPILAGVTFNDNTATNTGGGMYNYSNSNPTLLNVTFNSNSASWGGGMYNDSSNPILADITFNGNIATNSGGGMFNYSSSPTLTNITFSDNSAGWGGGMYNEASSSPVLTNITFNGNTASNSGGGMLNNSSSSALTDVTFSGNTATNNGGGMYNYFSSPTLMDVTFGSNSAHNGGGMDNEDSSPMLTNATFSNNSASCGGGMSNYSSNPTLKYVTFTGNSAFIDYEELCNNNDPHLLALTRTGGGMYNFESSPTLKNVTFSGNSAYYGGGMVNNGGSPILTDVIFSGNWTNDQQAGGMYNHASTPTLTNVTFIGNSSGTSGGGMYNESGGNPTLTNVTFSGNTAGYGGGMENDFMSSPTLTNVTFSGNSAYQGGGMYNEEYSSPHIRNTIFWSNTATNAGAQIYNKDATAIPNISYSVIQSGCPVGSTCTNIITTDPKLGTLGDYGGFTPTIPLLAGSSAIDTGNDSVCPTTDQRGISRPQGAHCDIGAYEFVNTPPPGAFNKSSPANAATNVTLSPTLSWAASSGATSYEYCYDISNNNTCDSSWISNGVNTSVGLGGLSTNTIYYWQVRAINTGGTTYANGNIWWSFTTIPNAPAAFNKSAPVNGATDISTSPTLSWGASTDAVSYEYCYDTSNDNICSSWTSNGTATSNALSGLTPGTTYYWHVRANNTGGTTYSNGSSIAFWSFTTVVAAPGAFDKAAPANGAIGISTSPTLSWGASTGAASYEYCYDTSNNSTCDGSWVSSGANASVGLSSLGTNTTYSWQVRAINTGGTTYANGNVWWSFTTVPNAPAAFNKSAPSNGATGISTSPTLSWGASMGAASYEYCYDTSNNAACDGSWISTGTNVSVGLSSLSINTTYYWQVRGMNAGGTTYANSGSWWSITTASDTTPPTVLGITRFDPTPTNASSVNFTATFSESVTGVDADDFSLATIRLSGANVSGVSGTGSVYTVTVNTGTGNGNIRLNVVDNNSIVDAASNPLGGAAAGDGNFTTGEVYTVIKATTFADVPLSYWSNTYIERLYNAGITGGCSTSPLNYCPTTPVTRAQMAIFLLRGMHGKLYTPPPATGTKFTDVPLGTFGAAWIEQLATEGITSGCGGGNYCPNTPVSRAQMAIFLVRAKHGSTFVPPTATDFFADVPIGSFGANFIEQLVTDSITSGCGNGNYCPNTMVKRDSMAVFLVKTFNLP